MNVLIMSWTSFKSLHCQEVVTHNPRYLIYLGQRLEFPLKNTSVLNDPGYHMAHVLLGGDAALGRVFRLDLCPVLNSVSPQMSVSQCKPGIHSQKAPGGVS